MNQILSRAEIESRFPNEWILMVNPEPGADVNFRGLVVAHEKDKSTLLERAEKLPKNQSVAVFFAGPPIPTDMKGLL